MSYRKSTVHNWVCDGGCGASEAITNVEYPGLEFKPPTVPLGWCAVIESDSGAEQTLHYCPKCDPRRRT